MPAKTDLSTFDEIMKDLFPLPGQAVKEWVLKARAERAELERIGPRVRVTGHDDNTMMNCRNVGMATLVADLFFHDCCYVCNDMGEALGEIGRMFAPLAKEPA